ncbi:hypothetical protein DFP72DRAFT_1040444 [Ephemerocybe angulata]|uniref:Uncharacterized protein n=1 Tax=Ephemerocybe angulata TaxID=980116 RepID=A0A8H6IDN2_9AGAR|nr:hypothetical protein DFP72DRAFT_1040444 [Tulosesus angulatus]
MSMGSLPQEILDSITDEAADESLITLKKLSLTSQCFLQRCRFHIFSRHIIFYKISEKAHRILRHNPSLFSNVRRLAMRVEEEPVEISEDYKWELEQISRVLDKVTNLETLCLSNMKLSPGGSSAYSETLPIYLGHCKDAFGRLFARPNLANIEINGFGNFPVHLLHSPPSLRSLSVGENLWFSEYSHQDLQPKVPWHLTSLEVSNKGLTTIHHLLKSCTNSIYANLVNLQFTIRTVQAHTNSMLIINNAAEHSALEMLDLNYYTPFSSDSDLVYRCYDELIISGRTIPTFPLLHFIKLRFRLALHRPSFLVPDLAANMIARMLCTNPQPSLTVAHVTFSWGTPPIGPEFNREQVFIDAKRGWGRIDDAFSDTTRFPKLCAIGMTPDLASPNTSFGLLSKEDRETIWSGTTAATIAAFPQTRAREGMLFETGSATETNDACRITDEAAGESLITLKRLSLTSRCFLRRCRFHIFSRHVIFYKISDKAHRILRHNPSLFSNVRRLRMWVHEDPVEISEDHKWELEQISRVLDKVTNLETLSLSNMSSYDSSNSETKAIYLGHCKDAFARLFARPNLANIEINGFDNFPVHLLHSPPSLQSLSVGNSLSFSEYLHRDLQPKVPWHLTSLKACNKGLTTIHHLLKPCTNSIYANLVNLELTIMTVQAHTNSMLIIHNAAEHSALEMLDLNYYTPFSSDSDLVYRCYDELIISDRTIPTFPLLHFVELRFDLALHRPSFLVPATNMISRMLCINPQPSLTFVHVTFAWGTPPVGPEFNREQAFIDGNRGQWGRIDDAFADTTRFPKLCAVGMTPGPYFPDPFRLLSSEDENITLDGSAAAIIAAFPQTGAREGMLLAAMYDNRFAELKRRILCKRRETHYPCWIFSRRNS